MADAEQSEWLDRPRFRVRANLREELERAAKKSGRSLGDEIESRLTTSLFLEKIANERKTPR